MEIIKRKISLESLRTRISNINIEQVFPTQKCDPDDKIKYELKFNHGSITGETIDVKVFIKSNIKNIGHYTDFEFIENDGMNSSVNYLPLINKINLLKTMNLLPGNFMSGFMSYSNPFNSSFNQYEYVLRDNKKLSDFNILEYEISGLSDDKLQTVSSYVTSTPDRLYNVNLNLSNSINYFTGVNSLTFKNNVVSTNFDDIEVVDYSLEKNNTLYFRGIDYKTFFNKERVISNNSEIGNNLYLDISVDYSYSILLTELNYFSKGVDESIMSLSALVFDEKYLHLSFAPEIIDEVFIDRGDFRPIENHLRLSEIESSTFFDNYNDGFFKII